VNFLNDRYSVVFNFMWCEVVPFWYPFFDLCLFAVAIVAQLPNVAVSPIPAASDCDECDILGDAAFVSHPPSR
jgi:hypothetical protein